MSTVLSSSENEYLILRRLLKKNLAKLQRQLYNLLINSLTVEQQEIFR